MAARARLKHARHRRAWLAGFGASGLKSLALWLLLCVICQSASAADQRKRIYFLEPLSPTQPAAVLFIDAFRKRLSEKTSENFDIFIDYMDVLRIPGQAHIDRTVEFLSGKYADAPPDVLIV